MTKKFATLTIDDVSVELPLRGGSIGTEVMDISRLYSDANVFVYDPGFGSTGACKAAITYVDGDRGILLYRGYSADVLAERASFLEVAHLLLYQELPAPSELANF